MAIRKGWSVAVTVAASLALAACAGVQPMDYLDTEDEYNLRPGLFSGADGEWVLIGDDAKSTASE